MGASVLVCGGWAHAYGISALVGMALLIGVAAGLALAIQVAACDVRASRRRGTVARFLGRRFPTLASDVLSTVELADALSTATTPRFSMALASAHAERTSTLLRGLSSRDVAPWRELHVDLLLALVMVAGALLGGLNVTRPAIHSLAVALGLREAPARESDEPLLSDIRMTLHFPEYSRRVPMSVTGASGDVRGLLGTEVQIDAKAVADLEAPVLRVLDQTVPAKQEKGRFRSSFVIRGPGTWTVEAKVGRQRLRDIARRIDIEPDTAPKVELHAPEEIEVAPFVRVPFAFRAADDFGLLGLEVVWRITGGTEQRRPIASAGAGGAPSREQIGEESWEAPGTLVPGAVVSVWLEARDNDTVSGPKVGRSRVITARVSSPEQQRDASIDAQQRALEQAVRLLGDRLEAPHKASLDLLRAIHGGFSRLLDLVAAARRAAEADPSAAAGVRERLSSMYRRLEKLFHEEEKSLAQTRGGLPQMAQQISELERNVLELDALVDRQQIESLRDLAEQMASTRKRLRELLERYADTADESLRREIERQLAILESRARDLMARAAALRGDIPEEILNSEAIERIDLEGMLDDVRQRLASGDVQGALAALEAMSQDLDRMAGMVNDGLGTLRDERFAEEERALSEMSDRLADLEATQRAISGEAGEIAERYREGTDAALRERLEPIKPRLIAQVERLGELLGAVDQKAVPLEAQEAVERAWQRAQETRQALEEDDMAEALSAARSAKEEVEFTRDELSEWTPPIDRQNALARRNRDRMKAAAPVARAIVDELERALPSESEMMRAGDRKQLMELGRKQAQAEQRTQELGQEMARRSGEAPALGEAQGPLDAAKQSMGRAARGMRAAQPREGHEQSLEAADRLARLRQQIRERRSLQPQGGQGMSREQVRIPTPEDYRSPRQWREEILEAMKEKAPASFRSKVRKYYEELVR